MQWSLLLFIIFSSFEGFAQIAEQERCQTGFYRTPQKRVDEIYETLEVIHQVFKEHNIPYSLIGGTQLGQVRHGGIIPWDDDADLVVLDSDLAKILALGKEFRKKGYKIRWWPGGYQIYRYKGHGLSGAFKYFLKNNPITGYKNAFVDLFPIELNEAKDRYIYARKFAQIQWPKEFLLVKEWEEQRTDDLKFGHLTLSGLQLEAARRYLDGAYGSSWPDTAYQTYDHNNSRTRKKVEVKITDFSPAKHSAHQE